MIHPATTHYSTKLDALELSEAQCGAGVRGMFGGTQISRCPCDTASSNQASLPPLEVGDNYFCDRSDGLDPLWTGENCTRDNPCCSFHNPPYFSVQLPAATTDRIEL